jgi:hypothetical protein
MSSAVRWYFSRASALSSGVFFLKRKYDSTLVRDRKCGYSA